MVWLRVSILFISLYIYLFQPLQPICNIFVSLLPKRMAYYSSFQLLGFFCLMISFLQLILLQALAWGPDVPTQGFVSLPFNRSFYHIQKPYDVPEDQRYSFVDGIHKCWVYSTDKPHTTTSQTMPRTEIAIQVMFS